MSYIIGIDPGTKGAVAVFDESLRTLVTVFDLPTRKQGKGGSAGSLMVCPQTLIELLTPYAVPGSMAAVEVAIVKPPMKLTAARTIGMNYGVLLSVLAGLGIGVREIAPSDWKARLGLSDDKQASISLAVSLYPGHIKELSARNDRAEAALIPRAVLNNNGSFA